MSEWTFMKSAGNFYDYSGMNSQNFLEWNFTRKVEWPTSYLNLLLGFEWFFTRKFFPVKYLDLNLWLGMDFSEKSQLQIIYYYVYHVIPLRNLDSTHVRYFNLYSVLDTSFLVESWYMWTLVHISCVLKTLVQIGLNSMYISLETSFKRQLLSRAIKWIFCSEVNIFTQNCRVNPTIVTDSSRCTPSLQEHIHYNWLKYSLIWNPLNARQLNTILRFRVAIFLCCHLLKIHSFISNKIPLREIYKEISWNCIVISIYICEHNLLRIVSFTTSRERRSTLSNWR